MAKDSRTTAALQPAVYICGPSHEQRYQTFPFAWILPMDSANSEPDRNAAAAECVDW